MITLAMADFRGFFNGDGACGITVVSALGAWLGFLRQTRHALNAKTLPQPRRELSGTHALLARRGGRRGLRACVMDWTLEQATMEIARLQVVSLRH